MPTDTSGRLNCPEFVLFPNLIIKYIPLLKIMAHLLQQVSAVRNALFPAYLLLNLPYKRPYSYPRETVAIRDNALSSFDRIEACLLFTLSVILVAGQKSLVKIYNFLSMIVAF